jgi:hypothetical protein
MPGRRDLKKEQLQSAKLWQEFCQLGDAFIRNISNTALSSRIHHRNYAVEDVADVAQVLPVFKYT